MKASAALLACVLSAVGAAAAELDRSSAPAPVDLPSLREARALAEVEHERAEAASGDARRQRDEEAAALDRLKAELASGGGWFAERRLRAQAAKVHGLVETAISAGESARAAASRREEGQGRLRAALFSEASRLGAEGDVAAREGARNRATSAYLQSGRLLAEAAAFPQDDAAVDPWDGLDAELPLTGTESSDELLAKARAYRDVAGRIERGLEAIAPELAAAESAAEAWERLSRFRGVLERAGAATADPRPRLDRLRERVARGRVLLERAIESAKRLDAQRAANGHSTEVPP